MKSIFDAVNKFKGVWPKYRGKDSLYIAVSLERSDHETGELVDVVNGFDRDAYLPILDKGAFDELVHLLENWQPTLSTSPLANITYAEYKAPFMNSKNESKPELVTVNGMQYEIGKDYEFRNEFYNEWTRDTLIGMVDCKFSIYVFTGKIRDWKMCQAMNPSLLGKITPAPVELVDGAAYAFEYMDGDMLGRYHKGSDRFIIGNSNVKRAKVKNITRLVPEVK